MSAHSSAEKEALFIAAYLRHFNISRAGAEVGMDRWTAQRLLKRADIQDAISKAQDDRLEALKAEGVDIIREFAKIAFADPNELMEYRLECCRHCWGRDHHFQHTTPAALVKARKRYEATPEALVEAFVDGGVGFDASRPPHPQCPECFGEGIGRVVVKDTRYLSASARALYAGAKATKDGIEIRMHDKAKALEALGRHLSLFNDKLVIPGMDDLVARLAAGRRRTGG